MEPYKTPTQRGGCKKAQPLRGKTAPKNKNKNKKVSPKGAASLLRKYTHATHGDSGVRPTPKTPKTVRDTPPKLRGDTPPKQWGPPKGSKGPKTKQKKIKH